MLLMSDVVVIVVCLLYIFNIKLKHEPLI